MDGELETIPERQQYQTPTFSRRPDPQTSEQSFPTPPPTLSFAHSSQHAPVTSQPRSAEKEIRRLFNDYGIKFIMHFKLRLEKPDHRFALKEGLVMSIAFFIGGLVPMIPYFIIKKTKHALPASVCITIMTLIAFGYVKAIVLGCSPRDRWVSAAQTLFVGALATGTSYGIVKGINAANPVEKQKSVGGH
ncbi:VIT family-domain-containing protein [Elsinoe ampelina]|uniref:VIT family-domain-containing protein n=1 Tax=Elsinoe ampelina TaxID=302913 RepID=A0A6A6FZQ6_9PEZI|nr:VIT family-domain-containing protein [Elsinoe ampelina]